MNRCYRTCRLKLECTSTKSSGCRAYQAQWCSMKFTTGLVLFQ